MTYDPFQTYSAIGAYHGGISPFLSPYTQFPYQAFQTPAMNPMAIHNPIAGIHPQQLQLAQRLAAAQLLAPFTVGLGAGVGASPYNPLGVTGLENPLLNPMLGQLPLPQQIFGLNPQGVQFGPQVGQPGLPFLQPGQGLAPQSWVGQPLGNPFVNPWIAQQLAARGWHGQGACF